MFFFCICDFACLPVRPACPSLSSDLTTLTVYLPAAMRGSIQHSQSISQAQPVFYALRHFSHFFCWDVLVICRTVVSKFAVTVSVSLYFQTFWPKSLNFFGRFKKNLVCDRKITEKNRAQHTCVKVQREANVCAQDSPQESIIQRDIHRTFPAHDYFKDTGGLGQDSLYRISKAYSVLDQEVGYCQGLSFLAAALLLHVSAWRRFRWNLLGCA